MATVAEIQKLLTDNNKVIREEIKEDIDEANKVLLTSINSTLSNHQDQIDSLKQKVTDLELKDSQRKENEVQKEVKERRHNVILNKIDETEESQEALFKAIVDLMNEAVEGIDPSDIDYLYRLGKRRNDGARRPILVRFVCLHKKEAIMKKWKFFASKKIDIFEDFPVEIRERRKEILPVVKLLKERGMRASVRVDKLLVDGEFWSLARAQEIIDEPPEDMQNAVGPTLSDNLVNKKRDRSSPISPDSAPITQKSKKNLPGLQIPPSGSKTTVFTVPSPRTSKLDAPFVTTPQKNMQYTTIIKND